MKNILFILSIFLCAEGFSQEAFAFFTQNGKRTSYRKLLRKSKKADIVLFGEYHNNPIAHWLEVKLTKDLLGKRSLILGAEMFERDNQDALDGYLEGTIDQKGLDTLARLWKNYKTDYKPWVDLAKREKLPIVATNIPRKYANLVYKKGLQALDTLPSAERKWIVSLPFPYDGNLSQYEKMKKMARHNPENLPMAQAIKDATMAESIETHYKKGSLFLHLNGSYHSDFFQGIYWYLRKRNPNLKILTISTLSQSSLKKLSSEAYGQADFILVVDEDMTGSY
ncbi:MAG: ChaN family lipoprotein [Capnocytophaga gingivalis]